MYIACPKCQTNFIIADGKIGPQGRKVKCSKCTHTWHQESNSEYLYQHLASNYNSKENRVTPKASNQSQTGKTLKDQQKDQSEDLLKTNKSLHSSNVFQQVIPESIYERPLAGINLPMPIPANPPSVFRFSIILICIIACISYLLLSTVSTKIIIEDVKMQYHSRQLLVEYKLANNRKKSKKISFIYTNIMNKEHKIIEANHYNKPIKIAPHSSVTMTTNFSEVGDDAKYVQIKIGSRVDYIIYLFFSKLLYRIGLNTTNL